MLKFLNFETLFENLSGKFLNSNSKFELLAILFSWEMIKWNWNLKGFGSYERVKYWEEFFIGQWGDLNLNLDEGVLNLI